MMKLFTVFNVEQADWEEGKQPVDPEKPECSFSPVEAAEAIANGMPQRPEIKHGGDRAFYSPLLDYIGMPNRESFDSAEGYYATLFHELVHSTGHKDRVGRDGIEAFVGFGTESYSKEELIAEMGAAYLCAEAEIEPRIEQSAAYIASWLKVLKNDKKFVVAAAAGAGKATDFILNKEGAA
jgi:antirestriction protein ArdC